MRSALVLLSLTLSSVLLAVPGENCGCSCCKDRPKGEACCCHEPAKDATPAKDAKRHALKGVITSVLPERSALMVKHEEIPGFMRAMTMMFKVDAETLRSARKGDAITALMSRRGDDWVLEEVRPAKSK